jgi:hypothetical protein
MEGTLVLFLRILNNLSFCILTLLNNAVSSSNYIVTDIGNITKQLVVKNLEGSLSIVISYIGLAEWKRR